MASALFLPTRQAVAVYLAGYELYGAMFTANPGTGGSATGEATGGSPPYARQSLVWSAPNSSGIITAVATFNLPAGTYTYAGICTSISGATVSAADNFGSQPYATQAVHTQTFNIQVT